MNVSYERLPVEWAYLRLGMEIPGIERSGLVGVEQSEVDVSANLQGPFL